MSTSQLPAEERDIVRLVRAFVDEQVRPVVRELEHANTYPEALIEQMKALGVYGLASRRPTATCRSPPPASRSSPRNWPAAG